MDIDLAQLALNFIIGGALGYLSGLLGIGGGLLAVPLLALGYGMEQQIAQGTALVLMAPNMVIGFLRYRQRNPITFRMAALIGSGAIIVSYMGSLAAARVSSGTLRTFVAVFMICLAANMVWRSVYHGHFRSTRKPAPHSMLPLAGCVGGFCSGFFSIGGGVVVIPILTAFFAMTQTAAQGLVLAMMAPATVVALGTYGHFGLVDWLTAIPMAVGSILTISHGVDLAHRLPEKHLHLAFALLLLISGSMMLFR